MSLVAYLVGLLLGGMVLGTIISLLGLAVRLPEIGRSVAEILFVIMLVHAILALREIGLLNLPLPQSHWQVKRSWARTLDPRIAALLYGLILGFGVFTRIPTGLFYALVIWLASYGDVRFGGIVFLLVGLGRAIPVMILANTTTNGEQMLRWSTVLHRWFPVVRLLNSLILAGVTGWFLAAVIEL